MLETAPPAPAMRVNGSANGTARQRQEQQYRAPQQDLVPDRWQPPSPPAPAAMPQLPNLRKPPDWEKTEGIALAIAALNEKPTESTLKRGLWRILHVEKKLTPQQKADQIVAWMVRNGFMVWHKETAASQVVNRFYNHDTETSQLFFGHGVRLNVNMPWLKDEQVVAIRTILIDRIYGYLADKRSATASTHQCLVRYFFDLERKKPLQPILEVRVRGTEETLTRLAAYHNDDVYFSQHRKLSEGAQGDFYVGLARPDYPVGIKKIGASGRLEAQTMRQLQLGGYLQVHHARTTRAPTWVLMSCYSGSLSQFAAVFLQAASSRRRRQSGGLLGARYMLKSQLLELDYLHETMRGVHQDIRAANVFVSRRQKRFILGDLGLSSALLPDGDARFRGYTPGHASPEQLVERATITPASDLFSLSVMTLNGIMALDPTFARIWAGRFPATARPSRLFPLKTLEMSTAFAAWRQITGEALHHEAPPQPIEVTNDSTTLTLYEIFLRR